MLQKRLLRLGLLQVPSFFAKSQPSFLAGSVLAPPILGVELDDL